MRTLLRPTRRRVLQGLGGATLAGSALSPFGSRSARTADLTVGFIYVGPKDDYGYNQAHAEGAATLKDFEG